MRRDADTARAGIGVLLAVVVASAPASAHGGDSVHGPGVLAAGLFVGGVAVLGASVVLDDRGSVGRRTADLGVAVGLAGLLAGVGALLL